MKTSAPAPARPSTASRAQLRRLAVVGLVAPVVALAACSGGSGGHRRPDRAGRHHPRLDEHVEHVGVAHVGHVDHAGHVGHDRRGAAPIVDRAVSTAITATITDPDLGHTITVDRVVRRLSWPAGQPVGAKQFEIVGVWVPLTAGSRYSASISPSMLSLVAASPAQTVSPTSEFAKRWGATPLKAASRSQRTGGWVFFKVDRGTTNALSLAFNRPPYTVSTTGKTIPQKTFSVVLTK